VTEPPRSRRPRRHGPPDGEVTVFVADEQAARPVDTDRWQALAVVVLAAEGVQGECELSVLFVDEATIADLNERFMGHEGPTDVLSFPIDGEANPPGRWPDNGGPGPDRFDEDMDDLPLLLGDVVVCPTVADRNAPGHAGSYDDELALLVVHGILHLLGLDHADEPGRLAMQSRERELLAAHHGPLASDPWAAVAAEVAAAEADLAASAASGSGAADVSGSNVPPATDADAD
jgi:probable rRNA maturation factor